MIPWLWGIRQNGPTFRVLDPAIFAEEVRRLLGLLKDDAQRRVAMLKLEDYTNKEIADKMDCSLATIERRLRLIRSTWSNE
jgi:DNA-directed RNA polymerase specialized sigma24 family protein